MTYKELAKKYLEETGNSVSIGTICARANELKRLPTIEELKPRKVGRPEKYEN